MIITTDCLGPVGISVAMPGKGPSSAQSSWSFTVQQSSLIRSLQVGGRKRAQGRDNGDKPATSDPICYPAMIWYLRSPGPELCRRLRSSLGCAVFVLSRFCHRFFQCARERGSSGGEQILSDSSPPSTRSRDLHFGINTILCTRADGVRHGIEHLDLDGGHFMGRWQRSYTVQYQSDRLEGWPSGRSQARPTGASARLPHTTLGQCYGNGTFGHIKSCTSSTYLMCARPARPPGTAQPTAHGPSLPSLDLALGSPTGGTVKVSPA